MATVWNSKSAAAISLPVAALMLALVAPAQALPGDLDPTFGAGGKVTGPSGSDDGAGDMALQSDGKIVEVGTRSTSGGDDFVVVRYLADGALDTSFSGDGVQTTDLGGVERANGVAIQPDGKIVVTGSGGALGTDVAVVRYKPDGALDTSFSDDGKQITDLNANEYGKAVAVQPDGGIVVAVARAVDNVSVWTAVRYQPDGTRDMSFGTGGVVTAEFGNQAETTSIALAGGGSFVLAGFRGDASGRDLALARYSADGSPDTTFSGDGKQTTDVRQYDEVYGVAVHGGRTVVTGRSTDLPENADDLVVARYAADGSLDPSFAGDGVATAGPSTSLDVGTEVVVQPDDKVVVAGGHEDPFTHEFDFVLLRLTPGGAPDDTFSGDGWLTTDFSGDDYVVGLALQPDGRLVAGGGTMLTHLVFVLARYEGGDPPPATSTSEDPPPQDTTAPVIATASLSPRTFAAGREATFRYRLSEAARVDFRLERRTPGRRVGRRCVKRAPSAGRRHRCTRLAPVARFAAAGVAGANSRRFSGSIGRRALKPGRYIATLVATDAAGNSSEPTRLGFRVVRPRKR